MEKEYNSKEAFEQATAHGVSLTDFWAPWCGPCRMESPVIEALAEELEGQVTVGKVNVDDNKFAGELGIMSIPTMIIKKDGEIKETLVGFQPKERLLAVLKKYM